MIIAQNDLTFLNSVAESVKSFAWVSLVVGLLVMAFLQTLKDLLPFRTGFHKLWLRSWFLRGISNFHIAKKRPPAPPKEPVAPEATPKQTSTEEPVSSLLRFPKAVEEAAKDAKDEGSPFGHEGSFSDDLAADVAVRDLVKLATAGDENALFNLPIEQLCGQINAAVQLALEHPDNHVVFLWCIGRFAKPDDFDEILGPPLDLLRGSQSGLEPDDRKKLDNYAGARARISQRLQRAVDGFQIAAGSNWKLVLQSASIYLSMLLAFLALHFFNPGTSELPAKTGARLLTVLGVGLAGGFIAPIARDILARLQTQRN